MTPQSKLKFFALHLVDELVEIGIIKLRSEIDRDEK